MSKVHVYVLMGVCGCGKTEIAHELAKHVEAYVLEGDLLHPKSNIDKMSKGIALSDDDRWDWLRTIRNNYEQKAYELLQNDSRRIILATCSSLKRSYRDLLRDVPSDICSVTFIYLKGTYDLILNRMKERKNHFMGHHMLDSQWATLEEPDPNSEDVIVQDISGSPTEIASELVQKINEIAKRSKF